MNQYNANGKPHGPFESYYDNGQLSWGGNYMNGQMHGLWESYFSNGKLNWKGNYLNNDQIGFWLDFNPFGNSVGKIDKQFYL